MNYKTNKIDVGNFYINTVVAKGLDCSIGTMNTKIPKALKLFVERNKISLIINIIEDAPETEDVVFAIIETKDIVGETEDNKMVIDHYDSKEEFRYFLIDRNYIEQVFINGTSHSLTEFKDGELVFD